MADLIKKIKIKKQDGTFTDYIPIGAEAKNIDLEYNNSNVEATLRKKPYYYENIAAMKADENLIEGDYVQVVGFEKVDDLGAGDFIISETILDNAQWTTTLNNGLIANLIYDNSKVKYFFSDILL